MTHLEGESRAEYVRGMFGKIAPHYDLMNRLMTFGQDRRWRERVIEKAKLPSTRALLLDVGAGTGDLGLEASLSIPGTIPFEADFTIEMMLVGRDNPKKQILHWTASDALFLPFPNDTFDAVVSGFLLRNVQNLVSSIQEQYRILRPGGRIVALDTTLLPNHILSPILRFYMHKIIPTLGHIVSGQKEAYLYLPESSENFISAECLAAHMISVGFRSIGFERLNFGTIAIHWGEK
jgi:demethylmenaquinone methyltransferase/2-methoxy-6-polyprenyl-1,4-benzoquinol methylase